VPNIAKLDCSNFTRPNCARENGLDPQDAFDHVNDLVDCNAAGQVVCVTHCAHGCAVMPAGFSDACDDCNGRADGDYCGRDLKDYTPDDSDLAVQCVAGSAVAGHVCGAAGSGACATKCPSGNAAPSCCQ